MKNDDILHLSVLLLTILFVSAMRLSTVPIVIAPSCNPNPIWGMRGQFLQSRSPEAQLKVANCNVDWYVQSLVLQNNSGTYSLLSNQLFAANVQATTWNATGLDPGNYTLTVKAVDVGDSGNYGLREIKFEILQFRTEFHKTEWNGQVLKDGLTKEFVVVKTNLASRPQRLDVLDMIINETFMIPFPGSNETFDFTDSVRLVNMYRWKNLSKNVTVDTWGWVGHNYNSIVQNYIQNDTHFTDYYYDSNGTQRSYIHEYSSYEANPRVWFWNEWEKNGTETSTVYSMGWEQEELYDVQGRLKKRWDKGVNTGPYGSASENVTMKFEFVCSIVWSKRGWGCGGSFGEFLNGQSYFYEDLLWNASSWWNSGYEELQEILNTSTLYPLVPYVINGNNTVGNKSYWTTRDSGCIGVQNLYNDTTFPITLAVANRTTQCNWKSGSAGNNGTGVFAGYSAWWHLDNATNDVNDSTVNAINAVASGPVKVTGKLDLGLDFESGSSQSIDVNDPAVLRMTTTYSLGGWVNFESVSGRVPLMGKGNADSSTDDQDFFLGTDNWITNEGGCDGSQRMIFVGLESASSGFNSVCSLATVSSGTWYFIVATYNGVNLSLYIDGVWQRNYSDTLSTSNTDTHDFRLGSWGQAAVYMDGILDEPFVSNTRVLNLQEIKQLYWNGIGNLTSLGAVEDYDSQAPLLNATISFNNNSWSNNASIRVVVDANDPASTSNIAQIIAEWGNTTKKNYTATHGGTSNESVSFSFPNNADSSTSYTLRVYANDTIGNMNTTGEYLVKIDTTKPTVTITSPTNTTYTTNSITLDPYIIDTENLTKITAWYSLNSTTNNTIGVTDIEVDAESDAIQYGNMDFFEYTIDENWGSGGGPLGPAGTSAQVLEFWRSKLPDGATYNNTRWKSFTTGNSGTWSNASCLQQDSTWYTVQSDDNGGWGTTTFTLPEKCLYNSTIVTQIGLRLGPGAAINYYESSLLFDTQSNVSLTFNDGQHNVTVYANDSAGNLNSSIVYFTVDATPPLVFTNLTNSTYTFSTTAPFSMSVWLNTTDATSSVALSWFNVNSTSNSTPAAGNRTVTLSGLSEGSNNVTFYGNDSAGNLNSTVVYFTIRSYPQITINSPGNTTTSDSTPLLNVSFNRQVNFTWYQVDGGANISLGNTTTNVSVNLSSLSDGVHNVRVYANVSTGLENSSIVYFTVDTVAPTITFVSPTDANNTFINRTYYTVNVSLSESASVCLLEVGGSNVSMTVSGSVCIVNRTSQSEGAYSYRVWANDSVGNMNSSSRLVTLDSTAPTVSSHSATQITQITAVITSTADEIVNITVYWGLSSGGPYTSSGSNTSLLASHRLLITSLSDLTTYYYVVEATDRASLKRNSSQGSFVTPSSPIIQLGGGGGGGGSVVEICGNGVDDDGDRVIDENCLVEQIKKLLSPTETVVGNVSVDTVRSSYLSGEGVYSTYEEAVNALIRPLGYNTFNALQTGFSWWIGRLVGAEGGGFLVDNLALFAGMGLLGMVGYGLQSDMVVLGGKVRGGVRSHHLSWRINHLADWTGSGGGKARVRHPGILARWKQVSLRKEEGEDDDEEEKKRTRMRENTPVRHVVSNKKDNIRVQEEVRRRRKMVDDAVRRMQG